MHLSWRLQLCVVLLLCHKFWADLPAPGPSRFECAFVIRCVREARCVWAEKSARASEIVDRPALQMGSRMARMERVPAYRALFAKHPELSGRQRQLEQRFGSVGDALGWDSQPIGQAFDRWIGAGHGSSSFHVADRQGGPEPMSFGTLLPREMRWPPMGVHDPDYRQPRADFVKPALLSIGDTFFSVYGDCQVAEHIPVKTETGEKQLGAMCYAGNLLYAVSEELPPAMQSCGVYGNRMIWVGDLEGHVVLYLAKERKYVRKVVTVPEQSGC